jgi:hypothetical protein
VFVNQQLVGESSDWSAQPCYEIKRALHAGDNVIVVGVRNENGSGGLDPGVNLELVGQPIPSDWSRSLFNGLGAVIVQSTREAGELRLTATADGLNSATATLTTQPAPSGPEAP